MKNVRLFNLVLTTLFILCAAVADSDTRVTYAVNGTDILNCTADKQSKIYIDSVDFNSSLCNITDTAFIRHFRNICNGKTVCGFSTMNEISDLNISCSINGTDSNLPDVYYHCVRNGIWSNWSDYSICSVTCGGGIQTRSRMCSNPAPNENGQNCSGNNVDERNCNTQNCSNPFTKHYLEEETAYLKCSIEFNEIIKIATIKYEKGTCSHNDLYGIGNLCDGRTKCAFNVTNSNVGSSCGANGTASLGITYNCILIGTVCIDNGNVVTCKNGYIQMRRAWWKASNGCGEPGSTSNYDVVREMKEICNERKSCTFTAKDSTFKLSCRHQFKSCSESEYQYICKQAKWNTWTEWSSCSKSCGTGEQVRARNCLNQLNTTDGYFIDCEGSSEESRVCNTIQCPYCNGNTLPNHMPSNRQLKKDVSTNSEMMTDVYKIECCGTINAFQFIPLNTGDVKFIVWRRMTEHTYKAIKKNTISVTAQNIGKYVQHNLTKYERIAVVHDDIVGWYDGGKNTIGYYDCSHNNETCLAYSLLKPPVNDGDEIYTDGLPSISDKIFAWTFSTTENRPVTINISSEPVTIPDHLNVDSFVITISILDPDYGDYIQDFKLDYQNEYFYLDTQQRSVHVKKALPHVVGQPNATMNFTCTVHDSCFNLANITVTFISFNVPPVITGLQDVLILDPQQLSDNTSFHIFRVEDPSDENVSCHLSKISPSTEKLIFEIDGNEAFLRVLNYSTSNSTLKYELEICCDDGTDETVIKLIVQLISNSQTNKSESAESNIIYVSGSIGGLLLIIIIIVVFYYCFSKRRKTLITTKSSNDSSTNSWYTSIKYDNSAVNLYDNIDQIGNKQIPTDHFEMSKPGTQIYENTTIFI